MVNDWKNKGDSFLASGHLLEAKNAYVEALKAVPDDPTLQNNALEYNDLKSKILVNLGYVQYEMQEYGNALETLQKALLLDEKNPDTYLFMGLAYKKEGNDKAIEYLTKALEYQPRFEFAYKELLPLFLAQKKWAELKPLAALALDFYPDNIQIRYYYAESLYGLEDYALAVEQYKKVLIAEPEALPIWVNLGNTYCAMNKYFDAMNAYNSALKINQSLDAQLGLAKSNEKAGYLDQAIMHYQKAIAMSPDALFAHHSLGNIYFQKGDKDNALKCFKAVLALEPDHDISYLVSSLSGTTLHKTPEKYVEHLFDNYAGNFEESLVGKLGYHVPQDIADIIKSYKKDDILDLGCGTGLMGSVLSGYQNLVGVDLSAKMLQVASQKNIYTRLEKGDLLEVMKREKSFGYDMVVSSDVFIYVGDLDNIFPEVHRLMRKGGVFAFSVESLDHLKNFKPDKSTSGTDNNPITRFIQKIAKKKVNEPYIGNYHLHTSGRYAHSKSYLENLAQKTGFHINTSLTKQLRQEENIPVMGYIIAM